MGGADWHLGDSGVTTLMLVLLLALVIIIVLGLRLREAYKRTEEAEEQALSRAKELLRKEEKRIRADAIKRSENVVKGKVAETLVPFLPEFKYNPRDIRFLGSPVDLIVFNGLTEGYLKEVVFIEVKTGKSARLTGREMQVQEVVGLSEVYYEVVHVTPKGEIK